MLVLFNKSVLSLSSYDFPCVNVITLFQSHLGSMRALKTLFHTFPLSIAYLLYMLASMASVRGVNVPMYTTLRRTTVAFTMVIEYMLTGQRYTPSIIGSGLNSFGLMWCNGVICGPISMVRTYMCGDLEKTINFPHLFSHCFMVVLLCSCVLAFLLNYIIFLNTTLNSALTQTICGNMKDLFTVGLGWMIFGGLPLRPGIILHLSIYSIDPKIAYLQFATISLLGFFGSGLYAYYKIIGR
ncbi:hypothetical protein Bca52824_089477 [Brassica carinata]|uniref:Uncharacterized protein n=1 Tax=Brassica carinata TaxID=52824 RepID=A0A8X7PHW6_BRACI|nr:hypothetical protein Bca52824_089477 [Brassica carinata]